MMFLNVDISLETRAVLLILIISLKFGISLQKRDRVTDTLTYGHLIFSAIFLLLLSVQQRVVTV